MSFSRTILCHKRNVTSALLFRWRKYQNRIFLYRTSSLIGCALHEPIAGNALECTRTTNRIKLLPTNVRISGKRC